MRVRASCLLLGFLSIVGLSFAFLYLVHLKTTCRLALAPRHVTDLSSLLSLLHEWESQQYDPIESQALGKVATELSAAIAAQREVQAHPQKTAGADTAEKDSLLALAIAGTQCHAVPNHEMWGDPVVWGSVHHAHSAAECCAACHAHQMAAARGGLDKGPNSTTCNVWVFCGDAGHCGSHYQECWLKRLANPPAPSQLGGSVPGVPWISGVVYDGDTLLHFYEQQKTLTMHLPMGNVVIELLPDLAPNSVRELRRLALLLAAGDGRCDGCRVYRVETNFLVQGVISHPGGYVGTQRYPNPAQKKVMERGTVCWAGGGGGPDWFVNLIDQSGFGDSHLCWGFIRDMTLMDQIVKLPTKPKAKPNEMTFLDQQLSFNLTLS